MITFLRLEETYQTGAQRWLTREVLVNLDDVVTIRQIAAGAENYTSAPSTALRLRTGEKLLILKPFLEMLNLLEKFADLVVKQ